jgi:hypothetical protein
LSTHVSGLGGEAALAGGSGEHGEAVRRRTLGLGPGDEMAGETLGKVVGGAVRGRRFGGSRSERTHWRLVRELPESSASSESMVLPEGRW